MTMTSMLNRYLEEAVKSSPKEKLVLMLYDGALRNLRQALSALESQDRAGFGNFLGKSHSIVAELLNNLNHEAGEEISRNLEKLYLFVIDRITESNLKMDSVGISESMRILQTLREGWDHALKQTNYQQA